MVVLQNREVHNFTAQPLEFFSGVYWCLRSSHVLGASEDLDWDSCQVFQSSEGLRHWVFDEVLTAWFLSSTSYADSCGGTLW